MKKARRFRAGLQVISTTTSGLAGRGERPGSLRVELRLRRRSSRGRRLLGRLSFFCWGCLLRRGRLFSSSLFRRGLLRSGFLRRRFLGSSLLRRRLLGSGFLRRGLLGDDLLGRNLLLGRSGFLRRGLLGDDLLRRNRFFGRSGLFRRGFLSRGFFRSCHCFLLDQVAKSTSDSLVAGEVIQRLGVV